MIIEEIHIYSFQLPLTHPLQIGNISVTSRSGAIIHLITDTNIHGFGEASPLPGLHREDMNYVKKQFSELKSQLLGSYHEKWFAKIENLQKKNELSPTVQFAIESAIININEQAKISNKITILPEPKQRKININALATGDESSILRKVEKCISNHYKSVKIKVGRISDPTEIRLIGSIHKLIGDRISLRLDANRAWELEEAVAYVKSIRNIEIEYLEEPLKYPEKLPDLFERTGLRIALDESLINVIPEGISPAKWVNTLILKPSVIGSVRKTLHYINQAHEAGRKVVISDTFHSGVGLSFLIRLASIIEAPVAMGFDTYSWFKDDILFDRLPVNEGSFNLDTVMNLCQNIDMSKIEKMG